MAREFLTTIKTKVVTNLDDPLLNKDAVNLQYLNLRLDDITGGTGTNISIDMGTFPDPVNASIDAGGF